MTGAPASRAILTASIVSAVSPDCDIAIVSVRGSMRAIAVAKFRGQLHLDRNLAQRAHQVHADHPGMIGGAAAGNRDLRHRAQDDFLDLQFGAELNVERLVDAAR